MTSYAFGAFIDVESSGNNLESHTIPIAPQKAVPKTYHSVPLPQAPDALELDTLEWGRQLSQYSFLN